MKTRLVHIPFVLGLGLILTMVSFVSISQATPLIRQLLRPGNPVIDPVGNAYTVPPTTTIGITYDEPISPTTVSPHTFAVHARQTGLLTQAYGVSDGAISLTPVHPLKAGELVQVSATAGTLSLLDGTGPLLPTVWEFQTAVEGGSGIFDDSGQRLGGLYGVEVALGDLDGDGDLDAFVVNGGGQANRVWLNDGVNTGTFIDTGQRLGGPWNHGVALGDLDSDGDLDAFVVNTQNNRNRVWLNDGTGTFYDSGQRLGSSRSNGVALGDLDGDGDLDAFVANYNFYDGQPNRVWLNDGTGSFHSGQSLGNSSSYAVALGDLDGDGDLDAFVANSHYYANRVWRNNGTGTFYSSQSLGNSISWDVALGDVDGDGDLDAFVANSFGQPNRVWRNNGTGTFTDSGQRLGNSYSNGVDLGDLDGDGDLDAFVANWNDQPNRVWRNNGWGTFTRSQGLGSSRSHNVDLGDVDGDGDLDAFTSNGPSQADRVWLNRSRTDLSLTKTVVPPVAAPGQTIAYTLVYANHGPQRATSVLITDMVPCVLTNLSFTYIGAAITPTGSISYTWLVADLEPGQSGAITVVGEVGTSASGVFSLTNQAAIATATIDEEPDNDTSFASNTIDAEPPTVPSLVSPEDGVLISGSTSALVWEASLSSDVAGYLLDWNGEVGDVGNVTQYTVPALADGTYTWTVAAYDGAGNTGSYADAWTFAVNTGQVVATVPTNGAIDVRLAVPVVITFSEAIDTSTFAYTVLPDPGGWLASWNDDATVVTLVHHPFVHQTTYTITVVTADDLTGYSLSDAPYVWHFATVLHQVYLPTVLRWFPK